jgi:ubiquinone/menaquinone biosynthesis C-methylase UbiE
LWPEGGADENDFIAVFEAVRALEDRLGDVEVMDLPSDDVLLGNAVPETEDRSELADRFRLAYLRWRLPLLKAHETDNTWTQVPEVEDKLVRADDDLLPNHPGLLGLQAGSVLLDVCGGLGRVARRLSPAVGDEGLVISIEMLRCLSDRAARFACDLGFSNLQFRTGLAQRIPLPDGSVDAAVNEWTGAIWELGLGPDMVREMARVVRIGGRIAVTHRLVQLRVGSLGNPWVQYPEIYRWMREAFANPGLQILAERVWGQIVPSLAGERATHWRKQYLPRLVDPFDVEFPDDETSDASVDVYLTMVAQRVDAEVVSEAHLVALS